jgi:hypothetical protein
MNLLVLLCRENSTSTSHYFQGGLASAFGGALLLHSLTKDHLFESSLFLSRLAL